MDLLSECCLVFLLLSVCMLNKSRTTCKRPMFASECDFLEKHVPWVLLYQCWYWKVNIVGKNAINYSSVNSANCNSKHFVRYCIVKRRTQMYEFTNDLLESLRSLLAQFHSFAELWQRYCYCHGPVVLLAEPLLEFRISRVWYSSCKWGILVEMSVLKNTSLDLNKRNKASFDIQ